MVTTRSAKAAEGARTSFHYVPRQPAVIEGTWGSRYVDHYLEMDCLMNVDELKRLTQHKYSAVDTSWLDEMCMKKFWDRVVTYYPMWLAPNLITLIGLIVNLITVLLLTYYCPTASESAPSWVYFLAALGLFAYQTLDATDGKQARRTGSASPLGELFDHGCDSISQIFITLNVCYAFQLGQVRGAVFFVCVVSMSLFYCAHWGTYCSGVLKFARFDVTEAQVTIIVVLLATGIFGPKVWSIGLFGYQLRHLVVMGTVIGAIYQARNYLSVVYTGGVGKNGSTVAGTSVLFPLCPLLATVVPFCMMYTKADSLFFDEHIALFVILFGAIASKATNRLIVAHMSRSELFLWDWIYLAPIGLMLNQYYDYFFSEYTLLVLATIYAYASLLIYSMKKPVTWRLPPPKPRARKMAATSPLEQNAEEKPSIPEKQEAKRAEEDTQEEEQVGHFGVPVLDLSVIIAIAILNSDSKQLSQAEIIEFTSKHFPYYNKHNVKANWYKVTYKLFKKRVEDDDGHLVYYMEKVHCSATIRVLKSTWQAMSNLQSKFYSMRYPELWHLMVDGLLRETTHANVQPPIKVYMKPPFTPKNLLSIALLQIDEKWATYLQLCSIVNYYFPYMQNQNWMKVGFERIQNKKIFACCRREDHELYFTLTPYGIFTATKMLNEYKEARKDPALSGLRDPAQWDMLTSFQLPCNNIPQKFISSVRREVDKVIYHAIVDGGHEEVPFAVVKKVEKSRKRSMVSPYENRLYPYAGTPFTDNSGRIRQFFYKVYNE